MTKHWWARAALGRTAVSDPLRDNEPPDARFELEWRPIVKGRLVIILGILACWGVTLEARLIYLQVVKHQTFVAKAKDQQQDVIEPEAPRGDVMDRNGRLLAYSVDSFNLFANPSLAADPVKEAAALCTALGDCTRDELSAIVEKLRRPKVKNLVIRSAAQMTPETSASVRAMISDRIARSKKGESTNPYLFRLERRSWRYYPKLELAANIVGFVGADGNGAAGIEARLNNQIRGVKGKVRQVVDGKDQMLQLVELAPVPGASVELTIDAQLQYIAERELHAGIEAAGGIGGSVVIQDPNTGEILAQASWPTYNPNSFLGTSDDQRRNRTVQDTYEPGSTFKIVTGSAALSDRVYATSDLIDTNPGIMKFPGRKPITEDKGHNYGVLSFENVIVKSSNVGAAKIGLQVGAERMLKWTQAFGFGAPVGADFPGEARGYVEPLSDLNDSALASMAMGYQLSVTPVQIASAASVVANGGLLYQPHIVRAMIQNGRRVPVEPKAPRRVITPEVAAAMTAIMEGVVESPAGTGNRAQLQRYQVAGKTGTAKKVVNKRYSDTEYNVSFVGFVPSRKPVFTILVVVDSPHKLPKYGGVVAAPIFQRIADAALQYAGVAPSIDPAPPIIVPPVRSVLPVQPASATAVPPIVTNAGGRPLMPDLRGMTLRDAIRVASSIGLSMASEGDGVVVAQTPAPGTAINSSERARIQLRRIPGGSGGNDR